MDNKSLILIVDDDSENLIYLSNILEQFYISKTALNGREALEIAHNTIPDLILLDIKMPEMDGFEVCKQIKNHEPLKDIPVMFLSAYDNVEDKLTAFEVGGVDYLTKPFYPAEVLVRVKTHLRVRSIQRELQIQNAQLQAEIFRRQKAEHDLRESEKSYRWLFEKTNDAVFIIGLDFHHIEANHQAAELLGYTIDEMIEKHSTDFIVQDEHADSMKQAERLQAGETLPVYERYFRKKNGEIFPAEVKVTLIHDDEGEPLYYHSVVRDISERKELQEALQKSEQRYRSILENASEAVFATDQLGFFIYVNPVMVRRSGYTKEELIGKHFTDLIDTAWQERVAYFYQKQFMERNLESILTFPLKQNQGEQIWIEQTTNLLLKDDKIEGFLGIARDITERKKIEEERERLIAELDAFAHTVAHDLKAPLSTLRLSTEMLEMMFDKMSEEKRQKRLTAIQQNADKMAGIIDALLLLASVRQKDDIPITHLNMERVVASTLERLKLQITAHAAQITIADSFPIALGYAPWIEEIWSNYILNALKYGGQPPILKIGATPLNDNFIKFWITDNGEGLTQEEQEQIFVPFVRLKHLDTQGHGLGLSIVQRIIDKLGGTVGIESEVGEGSTFYFTLPNQSE